MKSQEILIAIVALCLVTIPFIIVRLRNKRKSNHILNSLSEIDGQQLNISQYDHWNQRFAIGIDTTQNKLAYLKQQENGDRKVVVDLNQVEKSTLSSLYNDTNNNRIFEHIAIELAFKGAKSPAQMLEFYSSRESFTLDLELVLAQKWVDIINAHAVGNLKGQSVAEPTKV
ncbi:hypothetical protein [Pontibacter burrus]|uniref:Uncharacterized protein n=1 Tax=Pontibacter burrus TaxID=2704466 RepID=A0A6B3LUP3_9BACT|nr:hypothetical protein [Pontibacter burrus]NEM97698.1 hypothetical protein [Pontibacter burrus]